MKSRPFFRLMRLDKPVGALLLLFPTIIASFIASEATPNFVDLLVFSFSVFLTRSAGCVINDFADRELDKKVERTKDRPIASGEISPATALVIFGILAVIGILIVFFYLDPAVLPWIFAALVLIILYPFSKRLVKIPQIILALAFSMPIPIVFANQGLNPLSTLNAILLFCANFFWVLAYDTQYAITDLRDDLNFNTQGKFKVSSSAMIFGNYVKEFVLSFQLISIGLFFCLGWYLNFGNLYYSTISINIIIVVYQYFQTDLKIPETGFVAFKQNIFIGLICSIAVLFGLINMQYLKTLELTQQMQIIIDNLSSNK